MFQVEGTGVVKGGLHLMCCQGIAEANVAEVRKTAVSNEVKEVTTCEHEREGWIPDYVQIISMQSWSECSVV